MRHIQIGEGLRLRFPGQDESFDLGVEIGMLAALMDQGQREFSRWIATANVDQARSLAESLGYRLVTGTADATWTEVTLRSGRARPSLRLVQSAG
ncbi:MAG TPA: hypothetical protein VEA41_10825 [Salinarimonas sp.]|jgi:hypothetical protein|nr:hypothetical protein [Salinarimonas sp.]